MEFEVDKELLDDFVLESKEHLETIEDDFLNLEKQKDNPDPDLVNKVFRAIHTIKGCAGFLGMDNINKLAHVMETLLSMMRNGEIKPESKFVDPLLEGVDMINAMLDNVEHSNKVDTSEIYNKLSGLLSSETPAAVKKEMDTTLPLSNLEGKDVGFDITEFTLKNVPEDEFLYILKYDLIEFTKKEGKSPVALIRQLLSSGNIVEAQIETTSDDLNDGLPEGPLHYNVLYSTATTPDQIHKLAELTEKQVIQIKKEAIKVDADVKEPPVDNLQPAVGGSQQAAINDQPIAENSQPAAVADAPAPTPKSSGAASAPKSSTAGDRSSTIRINVEILDKLMMLAGELVLVRNQQLINIDKADPVSRSISQRLDIVTSDLQESIMRTRMQPIGNVFSKFTRIVRDLGNNLGKQIDLSITGSEVELDKTILESLTDPLTHLVRNCCDHGIELPNERVKAGKPEVGHVSLKAYHEGGQINITIQDDGKGINIPAIKKKVLEKQLKTEAELEQMSEKELHLLILLPGFSTVEQISDISGRGVGMDVVKSNIEKLGGIVEIESKCGEGTKIHLRLPLTLAIIPCLIVMVGKYRYAIPQVNLEELVCLYDNDVMTKIECAGHNEVYRLRNSLLPMVRLAEVLDRPTPFTEETTAEITAKYRKSNLQPAEGRGQEQSTDKQSLSMPSNPQPATRNSEVSKFLNFAVLKVGSSRFGLTVDSILGTEEIVVKPMHPSLKSLNCYSGATVMGDGKVALILDVDGIARHSKVGLNDRADEKNDGGSIEGQNGESQTVLIFKNGEKEQFAVTLPLIRRVEHINRSQFQVVGEKRFVTIDGVSTLVLKLDQHLNVSPCVEKDEMYLLLPKHTKKPFGVLISSLVDIIEVSVDINEESYMEDGLLGSAIVQDQITLFVDIFRLIEKAEPSWSDNGRRKDSAGKEKNRILLLEDAAFFRQLLKGYLTSEGHEVFTAENGQEGLSLFEEKDFDLIVSDIEMPVMDGIEFMKKVRSGKKHANVPAIAVTSLDSDKDKEKVIQSGFNKYQTKFDKEKFSACVAEFLG